MKPYGFSGATVVFAKDQPQYLPLPAHVDNSGAVTTCWKMTWGERLKVLITGIVWHQTLTFNNPLQPQKLLVDKPKVLASVELTKAEA